MDYHPVSATVSNLRARVLPGCPIYSAPGAGPGQAGFARLHFG